MARVAVTVQFRRPAPGEFDSLLDSHIKDEWKNILSGRNDMIIYRIRKRLGDGTAIDVTQYVAELASPATEGWKAFIDGSQHPSAVIGQLKHEVRVKGGAYKYKDNVESAYAVDPATGKSYFQTQVEKAYETNKINRIIAALGVVGARYLEKTAVPALIGAISGDGRYMYLLEQGMVSAVKDSAIKILKYNPDTGAWEAGTWEDVKALVPAFEPHKSKYVRPLTMGALVERATLAFALANMKDMGVIDATQLQEYLKRVNTAFKDLTGFLRSGIADFFLGYIDPQDATFGTNPTDIKEVANLTVCISDEADGCKELRDKYWPA